MGMMRKLLMGGSGGERTLVSTTTPTTSTTEMPAMVMKVGASYSVSWTGTIPSASYGTTYLFEILGGYYNLSNMCSVSITRATSSTVRYSVKLLGCEVSNGTWTAGANVSLELRFRVNTVLDTDPYYLMSGDISINGTIRNLEEIQGSVDAGYGLRYYRNLAGTFVIKKLS